MTKFPGNVALACLATVLLLGALMLGSPVQVRANGGPVKRVGQPGSVIVADTGTKVGVTAETLTFDFRDASPNGVYYFPLVTARYTLKNPAPAAQALQVAFFYVDDGTGPAYEHDFTATWNGREIRTTPGGVLPQPLTQNPMDLQDAKMVWLNPHTGTVYATHNVERFEMKHRVFDITMPAASTGTLTVKYRQVHSGYDHDRPLAKPVNHYTYLLRPARTWSFFDALTVQVDAPPRMQVASLPHLKQTRPGHYQRTFNGLPQTDLNISIRAYSLLGAYGQDLLYLLGGALIIFLFWFSVLRRERDTTPPEIDR